MIDSSKYFDSWGFLCAMADQDPEERASEINANLEVLAEAMKGGATIREPVVFKKSKENKDKVPNPQKYDFSSMM
jgi:hypothetical protein